MSPVTAQSTYTANGYQGCALLQPCLRLQNPDNRSRFLVAVNYPLPAQPGNFGRIVASLVGLIQKYFRLTTTMGYRDMSVLGFGWF